MHRPGAITRPVVISLGLGLTPNPAFGVMIGPGPFMAALASKAVFASG